MSSALGLGALPKPRKPPAEAELERSLAALALVDLPEPSVEELTPYDGGDVSAPGRVRAHVVAVTQLVAVGSLLLLVTAALLSAASGDSSVHAAALAGWGVAAALSALAGAALLSNPGEATSRTTTRKLVAGLVVVALVVTATGAVTAADAARGPAWVLFLPLVVLCGAALGPVGGLAVGGAAAGGLYVAAALSHTLDVAGIGRLVVLLPALPAIGWASGALAAASAAAVVQESRREQALQRDVAHLSALLEAVAEGDLSSVPALADPGDPATGALAVVLADTLLSLRRLVRRIADTTDQIVASGDQLASTAQQQVGSVHRQAAGVAETTRTIEQLAATAGLIAETAVRVSHYAGRTREDVVAGATAIEASTAAMHRIERQVDALVNRASLLGERVTAVEDSAALIEHIARRTTMLAVNASIEAARVNDAGTGFATVAEEIRTLAARAKEATGRIGGIVAELHAQVAETVQAGQQGALAVRAGLARQAVLDGVLRVISSQVDNTTSAARDIVAATRGQRGAADAVVHAMDEVTTSSERAREATAGHADAADRLRALAVELRSAVQGFTLPPDGRRPSSVQPTGSAADAYRERLGMTRASEVSRGQLGGRP